MPRDIIIQWFVGTEILNDSKVMSMRCGTTAGGRVTGSAR